MHLSFCLCSVVPEVKASQEQSTLSLCLTRFLVKTPLLWIQLCIVHKHPSCCRGLSVCGLLEEFTLVAKSGFLIKSIFSFVLICMEIIFDSWLPIEHKPTNSIKITPHPHWGLWALWFIDLWGRMKIKNATPRTPKAVCNTCSNLGSILRRPMW